jgi:hypothetical protein
VALSVTGIGQDSYPTTVEDYRQLIGTLLPGTGAIGLSQFTVTPLAQEAGLAVQIGPGRTVIRGGAAIDQGSYFVWSAEPEVLAWPGPSAQPRVDALILTIADSQYGAVEEQGPAWLIVQGVASTNPTAPSTDDVHAAAPAGAWARIAHVRVNPDDTTIAPANISNRLGPHDGGWQPLSLPTGVVTYLGRTPSYRIADGRVWLAGAAARSSGGNFTNAQTWGDAIVARVPVEARPPRIVYGVLHGQARRSSSNFVGGGLLRGEVQSDGAVYAYRDNMDYTTSWIGFDGFFYWLDQDQ